MDTPLEQIQQLPIADRLSLVEQIWDGIGQSDEPLILRAWHKEEARRRAAELDADPSIAITRDELWKRVDDDTR